MVALWNRAAALLIRLIVTLCTRRGRYVDYVHAGRPYMRRYVITGYRTGDPEQTGLRARLPNLYLHHIMSPDADQSLHDHPWPWGVSLILLGGYREQRLKVPPDGQLPSSAGMWLDHFKRYGQYEPGDVRERWFKAPAINRLRGDSFHRIASLRHGSTGVWTLFLAGPRRSRHGRKAWGYIVEGRGYVPQETRHAEIDAREVRSG